MAAVLLDRSTGHVELNPINFTTGAGLFEVPVWPLKIPSVAYWCHLVDLHAVSDPLAAAQLNVDVLRTLGYPGPGDIGLWPLWICDPTLLSDLLCHWRDWPITAFRSDPDATPREPNPRYAYLSPGRRTLIDLYQACRPHITPDTVKSLEMWEVAALCIELLDEPDRPAQPDVGSRWHRRDEYVDKAGERHVKSEAWTRNPDAPLIYGAAVPRAMPAKPVRLPSPVVQHEHRGDPT